MNDIDTCGATATVVPIHVVAPSSEVGPGKSETTSVLPRSRDDRSDAPQQLAPNVYTSKIMIIDDELSNVVDVRKHLADGGFERLCSETNSLLAWSRILEEQPDLLLMDFRMPDINGLMLLEKLRAHDSTRQTPVVLLTSAADVGTRVKAFDLGANDVLDKPVNRYELVARVTNTLLAKAHADLLRKSAATLEESIQFRCRELLASRREAMYCLAQAAESRGDDNGQHVLRVAQYASVIAHELGFGIQQTADLEHAALLHDVNQIGRPNDVPGSRVGRLLEDCTSPVMRLAALMAETQHEKWDGSGHPLGWAGDEIPIEGRIIAVCEVFDAVSTSRPYEPAFPMSVCLQIIQDGSGKQFDPSVVAAFFRRKDEILQIFDEHSATDLVGVLFEPVFVTDV